jgi:hypothetical protein
VISQANVTRHYQQDGDLSLVAQADARGDFAVLRPAASSCHRSVSLQSYTAKSAARVEAT